MGLLEGKTWCSIRRRLVIYCLHHALLWKVDVGVVRHHAHLLATAEVEYLRQESYTIGLLEGKVETAGRFC